MIPEWLKNTKEVKSCPCCNLDTNRKKNFVSKTLHDITLLIHTTIFSGKTAEKNGLLQNINPNIKLIVFLILIILSTFIKRLDILITFYLFILLIAILSKVAIKEYLFRVWLFIPLFSGIIALPVLLNILSPGTPLITLINFQTPLNILGIKISTISITNNGILSFSVFVLRIGTIVSLTTLLTLTTKWVEILKSLRIIGLPQIFVLILSLTYQFIFILVKIIQDMHLAKKSRTIKNNKTRKERKWIASRIATLLMKSKAISEETYQAMISRGFRGEIKNNEKHLFKKTDYIFGASSLVIIFILIIFIW